MSQTDEIHESFYDLFNQRFRRIDDTKTGPRFYANIAIGAHHKPSRIHPSFQCLVVVKHSEVDKIPHPFLNRFEKYALTHKILLDAVLNTQPAYLKAVLQRAKEKVRNVKILMINHSHSGRTNNFLSFPFFFVYVKVQSIASLLIYSIKLIYHMPLYHTLHVYYMYMYITSRM